MPYPTLILASASPRRADLLTEAGIPFRVRPAEVEEWESLGAAGVSTPSELVRKNAELKAQAVSRLAPEEVVLGADTLVVLKERIFGKPRNMEHAIEMLEILCAKTHSVLTGVCLLQTTPRPGLEGFQSSFVVETLVTFKPLDRTAIVEYLNLIHPLDKAGAYAAQQETDRIIEKVDGPFSNVVGLPIERVQEELTRLVQRNSIRLV
jgi:septum formation protein